MGVEKQVLLISLYRRFGGNSLYMDSLYRDFTILSFTLGGQPASDPSSGCIDDGAGRVGEVRRSVRHAA